MKSDRSKHTPPFTFSLPLHNFFCLFSIDFRNTDEEDATAAAGWFAGALFNERLLCHRPVGPVESDGWIGSIGSRWFVVANDAVRLVARHDDAAGVAQHPSTRRHPVHTS